MLANSEALVTPSPNRVVPPPKVSRPLMPLSGAVIRLRLLTSGISWLEFGSENPKLKVDCSLTS